MQDLFSLSVKETLTVKKREKSQMEKAEEYGNCIAYELERWAELRDGTQKIKDPFWEEGGSMNLHRNMIMRYREQIENEIPKTLYPKEYFLSVPPEYPICYIAGTDTLVTRAKARLEFIKKIPSYLELIHCGYSEKIPKDKRNKDMIFYDVVLGYVHNFEDSIPLAENEIQEYASRENQYAYYRNEATMNVRRYENYSNQWWERAFEDCLTKIHYKYPDLFHISKQESKNTACNLSTVMEDIQTNQQPIAFEKIKNESETRKPLFPSDKFQIHQLSFFELGLM